MNRFRIRATHVSGEPLIDFLGDHRRADYPDVGRLLSAALGATGQRHPWMSEMTMIASDQYVSMWSYANGRYEIDNDVLALNILVVEGGARVAEDIARALTDSGLFVRIDDES